jgi:ADP-ribose pyrophosphatase YjhB (NUDIX family)
VLLVRRAMNPERGKWALPAGYIDDGEDPRAAAIREVHEETGLEIEITRLVDVQIGQGSLGASIVIIYTAIVISGTARALDDADAVLWYAVADPLPELAFESTRWMIETWVEQQRGRLE